MSFSILRLNSSRLTSENRGQKSGEKEKEEFSTSLVVAPYARAREAGEMPENVRMGGQWNNFTDRYFHVPYGIIQPRGVENLLVAGRCVAGDRVSHAATRQMMCCSVTRQGAGVAAAVSVKDSVSSGQVDMLKVQQALKKQGVRVE